MSNPSRPALMSAPAAALLVGVGVTIWAYWATLADTADRWASDPQYSHGFLVPLFSLFLLWSRRGELGGGPVEPTRWFGLGVFGLTHRLVFSNDSVLARLAKADLQPRWWGAGIVLLGVGLRLFAFYGYQPWLDAGSLVVVLFGLVAAAGGRPAVRWAGLAVLFLAFMIPLPYQLQTALGGALQRIATVCSTYLLQTLGIPAVAQGNVILLSKEPIGVAAACSGLSMLMTFLALAVAVAILTKGWPQRIAVLLSALPIAVAANVIRVTVTGVLYEYNQGELARKVFHDGAGYLMMPLGLLMLLGVQHVVSRAVVPAGPPGDRRAGRPALAY